MNTLKKGQELKYIGKGFIGFDKSDTLMEFLEYRGCYDYLVKYKNFEVLVKKHEVK